MLTAATAALSCVAMDAGLAACLFRGDTGVHRFTIEAPGSSERDGGAPVNQVWVGGIVCDGRLLRDHEIRRIGKWTDQAGSISHVGDPEPAALKFAGHTAVVWLGRSPWSGRVRLLVDGAGEEIDLYHTSNDRFQIDLPRFAVPWWSWVPFAVALAALWLAVRPWVSRARVDAWSIGALIAVHGVVWCTLPITVVTDSLDYLPSFLDNVRHGWPTYFPPGYGLFLAGVDGLPGAALGAKTTLLQHVMMIVALLVFWRLLRAVLPAALASVWLAGVTWLAPTLLLPQAMLSENVALFTMTGALVCGWRAVTRGGAWALLGAGLCLGWGTIARVVPLAACGPALLLLLLGVRPLDRAVRRGVAIFGSAALIIAVPPLWFALHGYSPTLSSGIGRHLFNRVVYEQKLLDPDGPSTRALRAELPDVDLCETFHWDLATRLYAAGNRETEKLIEGVAKEAMALRPADYFFFSFALAWRNLVGSSRHLLVFGGTPRWNPQMETPPVLGYSGAVARLSYDLFEWFGPVWKALCWMAVVGVVLIPWMRGRRLLLAVAWVPLGYIVTTSFIEYYLPRYNVAITPLVAGVALLPLVWVARVVRVRAECARAPVGESVVT